MNVHRAVPCIVLLFTAWAVSAGDASAGAWPRGEGETFLSLSYQPDIAGTGDSNYVSAYYEYGATTKLTIGVDGGYQATNSDAGAVFFARYPIGATDGVNVFAVELGLGTAMSNGTTVSLVRPGLSWGRGYNLGAVSGWMGVESSYAFKSDETLLGKVDTTFGVSHPDGSLSIMQLQFSRPSDADSSFAIAPSYVAKLNDAVFLEMGASYEAFRGRQGLKIGVWFSY